MAAGDRFKSWIEGLSASWKVRLRGWMGDVLGFGMETFMNVMAKSFAPKLKPLLDKIQASGTIPPEMQLLFDEMRVPKGEAAASILGSMANRIVSGGIGDLIATYMRPINYWANRTNPTLAVGIDIYLTQWLRREIDDATLYYALSLSGYTQGEVNRLTSVLKVILPSDVVGPVYLRDKAKWGKFWSELPKLGLSPDQIALLEESLYKIPGVQDIIRYVVKEAYNPDIYKKFGQDQEYPGIAEADAAKAGVRPDHLLKEWIAHWELPGVTQGFDMMHRGVIDQDTLNLLLKARDIMPFWRKGLTDISWDIPGRIELRMMARYGLVDKAYLVKALGRSGLAEEYRDVVADMNLVLGIRSDLATRYSKGWITKEQLAAELEVSGLSEGIRTRLYQYIVKNETTARTAAQKDLTLAQIIKGIKKGKVTRAEGLDLITDMGYDMYEAQFIEDIEIPTDETDAAVKARELSKSDILAGLETGVIDVPTAREKLIATRYTPEDAEFILKVYQAAIKPPAEPAQREISKADVVSAVKMGLVTPEQGYQLLIKIGFSAEASNFILALIPQESPFSPLNYDEYKKLTSAWRSTQGVPAEELAPEVQDMKLAQARAIAEGRNPMLEQQRIQIDTIRRRRRKLLITREQEIAELTALGVPADYIKALVENDDTRLAAKQ